MGEVVMIKRPKNRKFHVYEFVARYIASNREAPTIMEIGKHFEMSVGGVHGVLTRLEREGLIKRTPNISRGIAIAQQHAPMVGWLDR